WIKYEEEVEESADRWSKPHVAIQPLMSVFEVRSCLAKAVMLLDLDVMSLELVAELPNHVYLGSIQLVEKWRSCSEFTQLVSSYRSSKQFHNDD
ncbi:Electrogenic sodium bicarbonate cotransporter 1, partial [Taenia solium]